MQRLMSVIRWPSVTPVTLAGFRRIWSCKFTRRVTGLSIKAMEHLCTWSRKVGTTRFLPDSNSCTSITPRYSMQLPYLVYDLREEYYKMYLIPVWRPSKAPSSIWLLSWAISSRLFIRECTIRILNTRITISNTIPAVALPPVIYLLRPGLRY